MSKKNSKSHLPLLLLASLIVATPSRAEQLEVYQCLDDETYLNLVKSINDEIDKLTSHRKNEIEIVGLVQNFNKTTSPLANFLGTSSSNDKIKKYLSALSQSKNNDRDFVYSFIDSYNGDSRAQNYNDQPQSKKEERFKKDLYLLGLGALAKAKKNSNKKFNKSEKMEVLEKELDYYLNSFLNAEIPVQNFSKEIDDIKKRVFSIWEKASDQDNLIKNLDLDKYAQRVDKYVKDYTTQNSLECSTNKENFNFSNEGKQNLIYCADKIENQIELFESTSEVVTKVFNVKDDTPEKLHYETMRYESWNIKNKSDLIKRGTDPLSEKKIDPSNENLSVRSSIFQFIHNFRSFIHSTNTKEKDLSTEHIKNINDSFNNLTAKPGVREVLKIPNLSNIINSDALETFKDNQKCREKNEQLMTNDALEECLNLILKANNFSESDKTFPLIGLRNKLDINSLSNEGKENINKLLNAPDFPTDNVVHYLNILNFTKNKYLKDNLPGNNCGVSRDNDSYGVFCFNQRSFDKDQSSLKLLLQLGNKLSPMVTSGNMQIQEIDLAAVKHSCENVTATGNIQTLCNKVKVDEAVTKSSAYARYKRGEIPTFQDGTWKWRKKTSNLQHLATGAVYGTQQILPTWLNLIQTKGQINYEAQRALYLKQNNYLQNQYMQNWWQNYYSTPQTLNNGYYNIYNPTGAVYNTGFGF